MRRTQNQGARNALFGSLRTTVESFRTNGNVVLTEVATELFESLDTAVSLSCEILLRYGDLEQLFRKAVNPMDYNQSSTFRDDYLAVSFLKKAPIEAVGVNPLEAAKKKFFEAEEACRTTNQRIRNFLVAPEKVSDAVRRAFSLAGHKIEKVLGRFVGREWLVSCRFGPGVFNASVRTRGMTSVYDKLQVRPSVTHDFRDSAAMLVMSSPQWARSVTGLEADGFWPFVSTSELDLVPGNRVTFVPKTALTHRPIAIEPLMNIYAQLGIGRMMRRRLRRVGVDLDDQTPNQECALSGSVDGLLATIDLSSASDTVAKELVRSLLPDDWFFALDLCRSKVGTLDGVAYRYEKFSSMGNGYTFELESLIFWALASSACEIANCPPFEVRVYGDDIVVPVAAYETLKEILEYFGFRLNGQKSFATGAFRESCGKDYYNGDDVRPLFVKEVPDGAPALFVLANGIKRLASRRNLGIGCDIRLYRAWKSVVRRLPRSVTRCCRVPAHAGDTDGLVTDWDEAQVSPFVIPHPGGWEGFLGIRLKAVPVLVASPSNFLGGVAATLYRFRDGLVDDFEKPIEDSPAASPRQRRDFVYRLQNKSFYGPWTGLGGWV